MSRHDTCNIQALSAVVRSVLFFCTIAAAATTTVAAQTGKPAADAALPSSQQIQIGGSNPVFFDPKTGKTLWTATVRSSEATTSPKGTLFGQMDGVNGVLYQNGKPADHFTAEKVTYDDQAKAINATGGVKITSLIDSNTSVSCDNAVWHMKTNTLIGTGNVVFHSRGFTQSGPSFQADTKLKDVVMRSTPRQSVRMYFQPQK